MLDAERLSHLSGHQHSAIMAQHVRLLRTLLLGPGQKNVPRQVGLQLFDSIERMNEKPAEEPPVKALMDQMYADNCRTRQHISNVAGSQGLAPKQGIIPARSDVPKELENENASDLEITVKHLNKGVIERFQKMKAPEIQQEINTHIQHDPAVSGSAGGPRTGPLGSASPENPRIVAVKSLRSGDVVLSVRSLEDVELLSKPGDWMKVFGDRARVHTETFGVMMHALRLKDLNLEGERALRFKEDLVSSNTYRVKGLTSPPDIKHVGWLKSATGDGQKQATIVLAFATPQTANEVIHMGLVWDSEVHTCQRFFLNLRVK